MGLVFTNICQQDHFFEGGFVKFVSEYAVAWIPPTFVDRYSGKVGKLSVIVKAWMVFIFSKKSVKGINVLGRGVSYFSNMLTPV
jgi:hypothetical protein